MHLNSKMMPTGPLGLPHILISPKVDSFLFLSKLLEEMIRIILKGVCHFDRNR